MTFVVVGNFLVFLFLFIITIGCVMAGKEQVIARRWAWATLVFGLISIVTAITSPFVI